MSFEHLMGVRTPGDPGETPAGTAPGRSWSLGFRLAAVKITLAVHLLLGRPRSGVTPADVLSWPVARWIGEWRPGSATHHYVGIRLHRQPRTSRSERVTRDPRRPRQTRRSPVRRRTKPGG